MEGASCPSRGPGLGKNCGVRVVGLQGLGICLARAVDSQFRAPVGFGAVGILWVLMFHVERALFRGGAGSAGGPRASRQASVIRRMGGFRQAPAWATWGQIWPRALRPTPKGAYSQAVFHVEHWTQ